MPSPPTHGRLTRLTLAAFAIFAATLLPAQSTEVELAFRHGAAALHEGRTADAEREFRRAVTLAPSLPEAHLDLGLVLGREGKFAAAIDSLQHALSLDPKLSSAHMFLGVFLYQTGHLDAAIDALHAERALYPANAETLSWLGVVELAASRPERAAEPLDRAAELDPNNLTLLELRARAHREIAEASYARMAQIDPNAWQVHKVRAELLLAENKERDAVQEYTAALAAAPGNADLYEGLGDTYRRLNELDAAQKAYARELELSPRNPIAMYNLGSTDIDRGDPATGVPLLQAMLKVYGAAPAAAFYLGRGLAEQQHDAEALPWLEQSARDGSRSELARRSYYELARLYRKLNRPAEAAQALDAYNRLRTADDQQAAAKVADWRKLNAPPATTASPPPQAP